MNGYVVLGLIMAVVLCLLGWFYISGSEVIQIIILFTGMGGAVVFSIMFAWNWKLYSVFYPLKVRVYGERYDSFTVLTDTRGRVFKDKKTGYEFIETPGGGRYKMPDRKYIVKSEDDYVNLFDTRTQQFPMTFEITKGDTGEEETKTLNSEKELVDFMAGRPVQISRKNIDEVHEKIIPEDQRVWLVDQAIPSIKEATKPPLSMWLQIAELAAIGIVAFIIIFPFLFGPDYVAKMSQILQQQFAAETQKFQEVIDALHEAPLVVSCEYTEPKEPPEPPPG